MTIQEAIKNGKKIKRKHWSGYHPSGADGYFTMEDILADDWEVEPEPEEKIEITRGQLKDVLDKAGLAGPSYNWDLWFAHQLGFKT